MLIFILTFLTLIFPHSHCKTIMVDGVSEWKNPSVRVGDSIIFNHKYHYKLYIFKNRGAFDLCNFTHATLLLDKPHSTSFSWHPSRLGFFYFSFNDNKSLKPCEEGQKLAIEVLPPAPHDSVGPSPDPSPLAGPVPASSSPTAYHWPFGSREKAASPGASPPATVIPSSFPYSGVPFINSNPAVPLPTGEADSATIRPLPISGNGEPPGLGSLAVQWALYHVVFFLML